MTPAMEELTQEERVIVNVAAATCFCYRVDKANVSRPDLDTYVELIMNLNRAKPNALTGMRDKPTVRDAVAFCAEQLALCSPTHAAALRAALDS